MYVKGKTGEKKVLMVITYVYLISSVFFQCMVFNVCLSVIYRNVLDFQLRYVTDHIHRNCYIYFLFYITPRRRKSVHGLIE